MTQEEEQAFIFGNIFHLANRLQLAGDQHLAAEGITTKQWFLTAVIARCGDQPPTLSEVAEMMNTSRQNVKQLALKLAEKGFLEIEADRSDARALRLKQTEKSRQFWQGRRERDALFLQALFRDFSGTELTATAGGIRKMLVNIDRMPGAAGSQPAGEAEK